MSLRHATAKWCQPCSLISHLISLYSHRYSIIFGLGGFWGQFLFAFAVPEQFFLRCHSMHFPAGGPCIIGVCRYHGGNAWSSGVFEGDVLWQVAFTWMSGSWVSQQNCDQCYQCFMLWNVFYLAWMWRSLCNCSPSAGVNLCLTPADVLIAWAAEKGQSKFSMSPEFKTVFSFFFLL